MAGQSIVLLLQVPDFSVFFVQLLIQSLNCRQCHAAFIHVGDGSAVYRLDGVADWIVASWPEQGEYAATTYFVTDDPEPRLRFCSAQGPIAELALFSDGIERLALDFSTETAFAPFFDRMFFPLSGKSVGRDRQLSRHLKEYLDSPSVCDKTDDDKTLVLAKRVWCPNERS